VLRTVNPDLYTRFMHGQATDQEVADTVFGLQTTQSLRPCPQGQLIEVSLILMAQPPESPDWVVLQERSPLLQHYRKMTSGSGRDEHTPEDVMHAKKVTACMETMISDSGSGYAKIEKAHAEVRDAVQSLERLLADLGD